MTLLLVAACWLLALAMTAALCVAAKLGDGQSDQTADTELPVARAALQPTDRAEDDPRPASPRVWRAPGGASERASRRRWLKPATAHSRSSR